MTVKTKARPIVAGNYVIEKRRFDNIFSECIVIFVMSVMSIHNNCL